MTLSPHQFRRLLPKTMTVDRPRFERELVRLRHDFSALIAEAKRRGAAPGPASDRAGRDYESRLSELKEKVDRSIAEADHRRKRIPAMKYDPELPITERRAEIAELIKKNPVVVICGETGSGKSTQIPKICLEQGRGARGMIGHTQPRRLAARAVASRLAHEIGTPLGEGVGYKIRFTDETAESTYVKVMTDGILLAEFQKDPLFNAYDTIIIDEAHERSLNIDFLLGMMKRVTARRPDFRLIITSATIDAKRFAAHFSNHGRPAPIIEVSGRTYPIEIRYRPPDEFALIDDGEAAPNAPRRREIDEGELREAAFLAAVDELAREGRGDILVFQPTQHDILETAKLLKHHAIPGDAAARKTEILPLYARLSSAEQQRIFTKSKWRKIVIATNVAESSLTVPGIRYVIDFGTARVSRYSARSRMQRLPIEPISRASADQRAGRCGRTGPGICIRLYSEADYAARDEFTTPEIRRTNLASVILRTIAYRLGAIERFPFLDPPARGTILDGYKTLYELGALDRENRITEIGRRLSRLPIDPRLARIILAGIDEGVMDEVLVIASALEIQDPRERPAEAAAKADEAHAPFLDERSDFLSYLKLWRFWHDLKDRLTGSQLRKACRQNFLAFLRMREWSDIYVQLLRLLREAKLLPPDRSPRVGEDALYDAIHRAILTGMLTGIAQRTEKGEYNIAGNVKFVLWPGSGLFKKKYSWLVAAERVETSRRYLRCAAQIDPAWIEPLAAHLITKKVFDPFWLRETGCVHAWQRVSLFGIVLVPKRRVHFGPEDPEAARKIFIREALVRGEFDCRLDFFLRNQALIDSIGQIQAKTRSHSLIKDDEALYAFYDGRIPEGVYDKKTLAAWYGSTPPEVKESLILTYGDICAESPNESIAHDFPDHMTTFSGVSVPLSYKFEPGEKEDGLTATLLPEEFGELKSSGRIGWLVPGLIAEKILVLIKSLPKELRRPLVPLPDTARLLADDLSFGGGDFLETLARAVSRLAGRLVAPSDFDTDRLPDALRLNLRVVDVRGNVLAEGRDAEAVGRELGERASKTLKNIRRSEWIRDDVASWDFGSLPETVTLRRENMVLSVYPALCHRRFLDGEEVPANGGNPALLSLRLFDSPEKAEALTRLGVILLFSQKHRRDLKYQIDHLPNIDRIRLRLGAVPHFKTAADAQELMARLAIEIASGADEGQFPIPRSEGDYNHLSDAARRAIPLATQELARWLPALAESYAEASLTVEKHASPLFAEAGADGRETFDRLFAPEFHLTTPTRWLREYPRYLKAIPVRYEKIRKGGGPADRAYSAELAGLWTRCFDRKARLDAAGLVDPEWPLYRWMLEEYQVSLFAQQLGTAVKVSSVRLEKQWAKLRD
ncbi:MAG: ATP-dependent RNA helicase HrpA [Thermoguttaceae bacterium]|nr:ATP-dependent RNA helicase HrpA [Thermoguttaceae bacterium]